MLAADWDLNVPYWFEGAGSMYLAHAERPLMEMLAWLEVPHIRELH